MRLSWDPRQRRSALALFDVLLPRVADVPVAVLPPAGQLACAQFLSFVPACAELPFHPVIESARFLPRVRDLITCSFLRSAAMRALGLEEVELLRLELETEV